MKRRKERGEERGGKRRSEERGEKRGGRDREMMQSPPLHIILHHHDQVYPCSLLIDFGSKSIRRYDNT